MAETAATTSISSFSGQHWYTPFVGVFWGIIELVKHTLGLLALLATFRLIEVFVGWLYGNPGLIFYNRFDAKYIFQTADLAMLLGFLVKATLAFWKALDKGKQ